MEQIDLDILIRRIEERYNETIRLAEKEKAEDLKAIERLKGLVRKEERKAPIDIVNVTIKQKQKHSYGSFKKAIKDSIELIHKKRFDKNDILEVLPQVSRDIAASCKDASLAGCLNRLVKDNFIVKVKKGKGSAPNIYKTITDAQE